MHYLVPHFIQENFAKENYRGEFSAVGLLVDISGFSTMTDLLMKHGPHGAEVLASVMREGLNPLAESVYAHSGFIVTLAGDAFTALFPTEEMETESYLHATAAAYQLQQRMISHERYLTPYGSFTIQVKVGLATGKTGWGIVTSLDSRRAVYYFRGSAVDGCAEAEHHARAGEIIMDAASFKKVQGMITGEPIDTHYRLMEVVGKLPAPQSINLPPVNLDIQSRFYPEALSTEKQSGEFRHVVNLFVNLPTIRNEDQLTIFMHTLFELQDRYGGLFRRINFGDKGSNVLMFWGIPATLENDIERALNFIIDLQTLTSIPINAGITCQIAHASFIGSPLMEEFTCYGRGINLAARFMISAPRGEIWVDEQIARREEAQYDFDFVGEVSFKGFANKQKVYILNERKERKNLFYTGDFVGRRMELERLVSFISPLWQGKYAGALVIGGEAGIGKSRLDALTAFLHRRIRRVGLLHGRRGEVLLLVGLELIPLHPQGRNECIGIGMKSQQTPARGRTERTPPGPPLAFIQHRLSV